MSISVIQGNAGSNGTGSFGVAFSGGNTAGNQIIAISANDNGPGRQGAPTDGNLNTYVWVFSTGDGGGGNGIDVWVAYGIAAGANTVSMTGANNGDSVDLIIYEVAGLAPHQAFDVASSSEIYQTANPITSNSITTQQANELLIGIGFDNDNVTPTSWTVGATWSNLQFTGTTLPFAGLAAQTKVVSATGSYSSTITDSLATPFATSYILGFADTPINSPTKMYLLNSTTITHPAAINGASLSSALPVGTNHTGSPGTALDMSTSGFAGTYTTTTSSTTSTTGTSAVQTSAHHKSWVSNVLGGQNILAQNWTIGFALTENNAAANQFMALSLYVVTSAGAVRGYIYDSASQLAAEFTTAEAGVVATVAGSAVTGVINTDQLVLELWVTGTQTGTTTRTITSRWGDQDSPVNTQATAHPGSYIQAASQNIFALKPGKGISDIQNSGAMNSNQAWARASYW